MIRFTASSAAATVGLLLTCSSVFATPSTTYWAPSTPYVQPFGVVHVTDDTYFREDALYPVDVGLEMGLLPWQPLQPGQWSAPPPPPTRLRAQTREQSRGQCRVRRR